MNGMKLAKWSKVVINSFTVGGHWVRSVGRAMELHSGYCFFHFVFFLKYLDGDRCVNLSERTGTGLITGTERTLIIPIASSIFSYFDTVYMYRLILGPICMIIYFP